MWVFLAGAILAEVTGTLSMKAAIDHPALYILMALGYAAAFVFLSLTLRSGMPLGIAYGIWGASGVALTAAASALLFAEPITVVMALGIVAIMAGVILVEVGHRGQARPTVAATEAEYPPAAATEAVHPAVASEAVHPAEAEHPAESPQREAKPEDRGEAESLRSGPTSQACRSVDSQARQEES
ncbi:MULTISPECIES: multidrug efflux SMR transporter [unclassified Brevibacterium]|uniref:DMT family transporter n=1 Tax=unclassified Brevibacterium TaxID=2614124 RepID=UPI0032C45E30